MEYTLHRYLMKTRCHSTTMLIKFYPILTFCIVLFRWLKVRILLFSNIFQGFCLFTTNSWLLSLCISKRNWPEFNYSGIEIAKMIKIWHLRSTYSFIRWTSVGFVLTAYLPSSSSPLISYQITPTWKQEVSFKKDFNPLHCE